MPVDPGPVQPGLKIGAPASPVVESDQKMTGLGMPQQVLMTAPGPMPLEKLVKEVAVTPGLPGFSMISKPALGTVMGVKIRAAWLAGARLRRALAAIRVAARSDERE